MKSCFHKSPVIPKSCRALIVWEVGLFRNKVRHVLKKLFFIDLYNSKTKKYLLTLVKLHTGIQTKYKHTYICTNDTSLTTLYGIYSIYNQHSPLLLKT